MEEIVKADQEGELVETQDVKKALFDGASGDQHLSRDDIFSPKIKES